MKVKKMIAGVLSVLLCFMAMSSVVVFADDGEGRSYVYFEDFSGSTVNTEQTVAGIKASGGLWANHQSGSEYVINNGAFKYTERANGDYFDIRFYIDGLKKDLAQDFILSFRIKPLVDKLSFEVGWRDKSQSSFENKLFKVVNGKYTVNGTAYSEASLSKDKWSLVEIAYHYNENATPVVSESGEPTKGAIDRLTIMLDGKTVATVDTTLDFYNIDQFRLFQWASGEYALDNLAIALGSESLIGEPWEEPDDSQASDGTGDKPFTGTVLFCEDFEDAINTSSSQAACEAANGFWACNNSGSQYTLEDGTMKYTKRMSKDYMDIRFYYDKTAQDLSRDFILSFKVKPLASDLGFNFTWLDKASSESDKSVKLSGGRFRAGSKTYTDVVLEKDTWYLVEIAFNYNETATAVTGETGAVDSYTLMVNGKAVATVSANMKFHNIDHFRLFQSATCRYELDDLTIATGTQSLDTDNSFKDWTPKVYYFDKADASNYAYSFCAVGDTQKVTRGYPDKLACIYDWIVENAEKRKIKYVFGLGDITDQDIDEEWSVALEQINKLNGVVPYSVIRGNHDGNENINKYFGNTVYTSQFEGFFEEGKIETSYVRIQVGDVKYLMITFDFGPTDAELEWAADIIEANPDHRVIITTHTYLLTDGSTITSDNTHAPSNYEATSNNGDQMWEKLVSKYENIFLVMSGHIGTDYVITNQRTGINGNVVTEMLIDPQTLDGEIGPTGMITMLYFSEDGKEIAVETYSTVQQKYFLEENQFTVDIASWVEGADNSQDKPQGGSDGADGLVPYVGENGNWWIGDTDTGVKAAGEDGKDGVDGKDGKDGELLEEQTGGCKSTAGVGAALLTVASAAAALIKKKRRR